jgi:hypothetical protein
MKKEGMNIEKMNLILLWVINLLNFIFNILIKCQSLLAIIDKLVETLSTNLPLSSYGPLELLKDSRNRLIMKRNLLNIIEL